ncbi:MAG: TonB-dependent receptor [Gammaproteobacteria bacterium]|nr:TonB-dependent receptor [Gammaproteobacteria bacterium]
MAVAGLLTASGAVAAAEGGLEEVIVTAQFREQNLQATPIAITAVTGEMLDARSQTNIAAVANQAPSVTLKPQGAAFGPSMAASIRGIGQYDFNPALEPGVGIYVDDVYYATLTGSLLDLLDLDRVEISRGPQGTLAGRNSIGGAVKLYSKKARGDGSGYLSGTYGSHRRVDLRGSADMKLADNVFMRLSGVAKRQGGYVARIDYGCANPGSGIPTTRSATQGCIVGRDGDVNYNALRATLRLVASEDLEFNVIADVTQDDRNPPAGVLLYASNTNPNIRVGDGSVPYDSRFVPPWGSYYNYAGYYSPAGTFITLAPGPAGPPGTAIPLSETRNVPGSEYRSWGISGRIDWRAAERLSLEAISAYRTYQTEFTNDDDLSPLAIGNGHSQLDFHSFSQELRLNGTFGAEDAVEYTLGGFYMDQKSVYPTYQDLRYVPVYPLQFQGDDPVNADNKAAFAHVSWHATGKLTLTGGLRYTKEHKDYTFSRRNRDGTVNPWLAAVDGATGQYDGSKTDYRANVQYQWTPDLMTYVQVSTGFKGGGIGPRPFNAAQAREFGPEELTAYEAGVKSDLFDRRLRVNGALFFSKYKDILLTLLSCPQFGGPGPCALPQNAGDADVKGVELEAMIRPTGALSLDAAYSYLDFDYTRINPQAGGPTLPRGVQKGMITPLTPKTKWSLGAQYEIPAGAGTLTPRIDASYQSEMYSNATNGPRNYIDGYTLINARLTWRNAERDLEGSLEVTNLADKYYMLTSFDLTGAGAGNANGQPGRPREFAFTVKKSF